MVAHALLFFMLSSGGALGAVFFHRKYEEMLPLTCSSIVLILFLCGIFGFLGVGVYIVCVMCFVSYLLAVIQIIRKRCALKALHCFFTPGFIVFFLFYAGLTYFLHGSLVTLIDEFAHWADTVKMMVAINDFGTNQAAMSLFSTYPPGLSLFQYFTQKVMILTDAKSLFSEWRLFFCNQIFMLSFLLPFFGYFTWKNPMRLIVMVLRCRHENILDYISVRYAEILHEKLGERVLPPFTPPLNRIQTLHVRHIMLKLETSLPILQIRSLLEQTNHQMQSFPAFRQVLLHYEVDN